MTEQQQKPRVTDRWWALGAIVVVAWVVVELIVQGADGVVPGLISGVVYGALFTGALLYRRYTDARKTGADSPDDVPVLDRRIRTEDIPQDPEQRAVMRRLVWRRRKQLRMGHPWVIPVVGALFLLTAVLWFAAGRYGLGATWLVGGACFDGWLYWLRGREAKRLARVEQRLTDDPRQPA
ncbi:hypothetical protein [Streptomyces odontomachi]|uniref:hypothetical protein n=1 Tax=Streptomyces odontomachi TaxID=2944940 RepID=UPI00210C9491|nr:hypothetical protein [Streptomyces sp. ODS25]